MEISKKENYGASEEWIPGRQKKYPLHLREMRMDYLNRLCMKMNEILFQFIESYY